MTKQKLAVFGTIFIIIAVFVMILVGCECIHEWGEWTTEKEATCLQEGEKVRSCSKCNQTQSEEIEKVGHNYNLGKAESEHIATEANCQSRAKYYYSCVCGANGTETFENGDLGECSWGKWTTNGNDTHTRTCTLNSDHVQSGGCEGGAMTCVKKAVCDKCESEYGDSPLGHTLSAETEYIPFPEDHCFYGDTEKKTAVVRCTTCGEIGMYFYGNICEGLSGDINKVKYVDSVPHYYLDETCNMCGYTFYVEIWNDGPNCRMIYKMYKGDHYHIDGEALVFDYQYYPEILPQRTVSETEWSDAFNLLALDNLKMEHTSYVNNEEDNKDYFEYDGTTFYTFAHDIQSGIMSEYYCTKDGNKYFKYSKTTTGIWVQEEITETEYNQRLNTALSGLGDLFIYSDFGFNSETDCYKADSISITDIISDVSIKFKDKKLEKIRYTTDYGTGVYDDVIEFLDDVVDITLPSTYVTGTKLSETEWNDALNFSNVENYEIVIRMNNETYEVIKKDGDIIYDFHKGYGTYSYYAKNGIDYFKYTSSDGENYKIESIEESEYNEERLLLAYAYQYQYFTYDSEKCVYVSGSIPNVAMHDITIAFENKQLVMLSGIEGFNNMQILAYYNNVELTLPTVSDGNAVVNTVTENEWSTALDLYNSNNFELRIEVSDGNIASLKRDNDILCQTEGSINYYVKDNSQFPQISYNQYTSYDGGETWSVGSMSESECMGCFNQINYS